MYTKPFLLKENNKISPECKLHPDSVWLGWLDLNQRMTESKSVALPLGYTPIFYFYIKIRKAKNLPCVIWGG